MTAHVEVVPAEDWHIPYLALNMRQADLDELYASDGRSPEVCLQESLWASDEAWAVMVDGVPAAMFGVAPHAFLSGVGQAWLLATDDLTKITTKFLRNCRRYIGYMHENYPVLTNAVDVRNTYSLEWMEWCGFAPVRYIESYNNRGFPHIQYMRNESV